MPRQLRRAGFTLVELLVVIAIISALASLLIPTLGKARIKMKKTQCLSNLRQLGQTAMLYSDEYDGWFPLAKTKGAPAYASLQRVVDWAGDLKPQIFICPESRDARAEKDEDGNYMLDEGSCSYAWITRRTSNTDRGDQALGADDSIRDDDRDIVENHAKGMHVVYVDMSAIWLKEEELPEGTERPKGLIGNGARSND